MESGFGDQFLTQQPVANDSMYPVYFWDRANVPVHTVSLIHQFALELRSVRVDADRLRTVT